MIEVQVDQPIRLFAPAKVNLGLEITGRRDDGYHEIVTVLQAVSLFDVIDLLPAGQFSYSGDMHVDAEQDLALRAIRLFETRYNARLTAEVRIEKRIPIAGGLGGGSSEPVRCSVRSHPSLESSSTPLKKWRPNLAATSRFS